MPSTLGDIRQLVTVDIGGRSDSSAILVIDHGINLGILLAAILFKPVELRKSSDVTYIANAEYYSFSTTSWLDIVRVRNTTSNYDLRFVAFDLLDRIVSSSLTIVKYYSIYGESLYLRKIPTANTSIRIYYLEEPAKLTNSSDPLPFDSFDGFIRTVASASVFAAFEEADSVNMWNSIAAQLNTILSLGTDNKATFGKVKGYLDQMVSITQGK